MASLVNASDNQSLAPQSQNPSVESAAMAAGMSRMPVASTAFWNVAATTSAWDARLATASTRAAIVAGSILALVIPLVIGVEPDVVATTKSSHVASS